jgi:hypothetical protein
MSTAQRKKNEMFLGEVQLALFNFQLLEEGLKTYIDKAYDIIRHSLPSQLRLQVDPAEYENAPLERLIKMYSKLSKNAALVDRLKRLVKPRNYCAHRAYAHEFQSRIDPSVNVHVELRTIVTANSEAMKALDELHEELNAIASLHSRVSWPRMSGIARRKDGT